MQPTTPSSVPAPDNDAAFEKIFLVLLFIITISQFSTFGYQSVLYILGVIFNVPVVSTPLDVVIGAAAMAASALVFAGSALQWRGSSSAWKYLSLGAGLFIVKNIFDLVNVTILFAMANKVDTIEQIQALASQLGEQFFQMAFWIIVYFYFRSRQ